MEPYSEKIKYLQYEIDGATEIMKKNIENTMERGEKIDDLQMQTENMAKQSRSFKTSAIQLKRKICINNYKLIIIIVGIIMLAIGITIVSIYLKYR